ncbi:MAG: heavy-metal-associated domain-containing protein [Actinomycetes bacterium]
MEHPNPDRPALEETVFSVPGMTCRHCVRTISAQVRDVIGVVALEADATTRTVRVHGPAEADALAAAIAAAGYEAVLVSRSGRSQEPTGGQHP